MLSVSKWEEYDRLWKYAVRREDEVLAAFAYNVLVSGRTLWADVVGGGVCGGD